MRRLNSSVNAKASQTMHYVIEERLLPARQSVRSLECYMLYWHRSNLSIRDEASFPAWILRNVRLQTMPCQLLRTKNRIPYTVSCQPFAMPFARSQQCRSVMLTHSMYFSRSDPSSPTSLSGSPDSFSSFSTAT